MSHPVIRVENLSKQYRLGEFGTGSLAHDFNRLWYSIRGKDDPYLKVGDVNERTVKGGSGYVWALQKIAFEIKQGEAVGVIGRNGAGKSTLLKILSRTTAPTTGTIKLKGKVASLLEVGTGFHPDLSGRENIFLNGAILGMTKAEIKGKFDEIVDFAGVEKYIDTPVKRYSSGMYVRLAFGVAAHLEPEILIVDEVLAVGDTEFQKKALGKMKSVSTNEGRTVLFVSHNLPAINLLCSKAIYLKNGLLKEMGGVETVIRNYKSEFGKSSKIATEELSNEFVKISEIQVLSESFSEELYIEKDILIRTKFIFRISGKTVGLSYFIFNDEDILLFEAFAAFANNKNSEEREYEITLSIPKFTLNSGEYYGKLVFGESQKYVLLSTDVIFRFIVNDSLSNSGDSLNRIPGLMRPLISYDVK